MFCCIMLYPFDYSIELSRLSQSNRYMVQIGSEKDFVDRRSLLSVMELMYKLLWPGQKCESLLLLLANCLIAVMLTIMEYLAQYLRKTIDNEVAPAAPNSQDANEIMSKELWECSSKKNFIYICKVNNCKISTLFHLSYPVEVLQLVEIRVQLQQSFCFLLRLFKMLLSVFLWLQNQFLKIWLFTDHARCILNICARFNHHDECWGFTSSGEWLRTQTSELSFITYSYCSVYV